MTDNEKWKFVDVLIEKYPNLLDNLPNPTNQIIKTRKELIDRLEKIYDDGNEDDMFKLSLLEYINGRKTFLDDCKKAITEDLKGRIEVSLRDIKNED